MEILIWKLGERVYVRTVEPDIMGALEQGGVWAFVSSGASSNPVEITIEALSGDLLDIWRPNIVPPKVKVTTKHTGTTMPGRNPVEEVEGYFHLFGDQYMFIVVSD